MQTKTKYQNKKTIRDFLYIDPLRLQSLSSQLFEGYVEKYIEQSFQSINEIQENRFVSNKKTENANLDSLSDGIARTNYTIMLDHQYNKLEKSLIDGDFLTTIDNIDDLNSITVGQTKPIKISGRIVINDFKSMQILMENINKLQNNIAALTDFGQQQNNNHQQSNSKKHVVNEVIPEKY